MTFACLSGDDVKTLRRACGSSRKVRIFMAMRTEIAAFYSVKFVVFLITVELLDIVF